MSYWAEMMLLWSGQTLILIGALWIAAAALRGSSAAERHRLWLVGLMVIAVLPAANVFVRSFSTTLPPAEPARHVTQLHEVAAVPLPEQSASIPINVITSSVESSNAPATPLPDPMTILFGVWLGGVLIYLYSPVRSYLQSRRLRATAVIEPDVALRVLVGYSSEVRAPMLAGIFRPMVLLPANIGSWTDADEQRAIVLHEAAHFERRDHLINLFQTLVGAVLFFHPAVRYALRQLVLERELACDQRVLSAGANATAYAEALLKVAERAITVREGYEPAFNTSGRILDRRMTMIMNHRPSLLRRSWLGQVLRAAALCTLALLLLPERVILPESPLALPVLVAAVPEMPAAQETATQAPSIPVVAIAVAPVAVPPPVQAEIGSVSGTVLDQSGAVVPGVTVTLRSTIDGSTLPAVTNARGAYTFPRVNVGQYRFEAFLPGFLRHSREVFVRAQAEVHDAVLHLGFETQLEVSVAAPQTPPAPATAAPTQRPIRVGGDIAAPNLIYAPKPVYPAGAFAKLAQDSVKLDAVIGKDGTVQSVVVNPAQGGSNFELIHAAVDAVKLWRYRPAMLNGAPIEVPMTITVNFTMQ